MVDHNPGKGHVNGKLGKKQWDNLRINNFKNKPVYVCPLPFPGKIHGTRVGKGQHIVQVKIEVQGGKAKNKIGAKN